MKKVLLAASFLLLAASCSVSKTKLSKDAKDVKVLYTKPKKGCSAVSSITGVNSNGVLELAINHARNIAADKGANTIVIQDKVNVSKDWKIHAVGYICK